MKYFPAGVTEDTIWVLKDFYKELAGRKLRMPTKQDILDCQADIESLLPPDKGYVTYNFANEVAAACQYCKEYYLSNGKSILDILINNPNIKKFNFADPENGES